MLTFNKEKHEYKLGEEVIPSVSQILKDGGLIEFGSIPQHILDNAANRGTLIHFACELWDEGTLDEENLDPVIVPYLEAWKKFRADTKCEIIASEEIVYHKNFKYAGTLDRRLKIDGKTFICDIKTGAPRPWHSIQTAGYALCFPEKYERMCVYLKKDCSYEVKIYTSQDDEEVFLAALAIHKFKMRTKKKRK